MTDERIRIDQPRRRSAEQLHLLTAHHIGAAITDVGYAGNDCLALARADQRRNELVHPRRTANVRSFFPAAVRSDHAGEQQRLVAEALADFRNGSGKTAGGDRQNALAVLELLGATAALIARISAPIGGPPIDRDESICPAHAFVAHSRKPREGYSLLPRFSFL